MTVEGDWAERVTGLRDMRCEIAMMVTPDGHSRLEHSRFEAPPMVSDHRNAPVNAPGYLRVMFTDEIYQRADAFLIGRQTYEIFAATRGTWDDPGSSPIWTALHTKPKYVASTTLTDPQWTITIILSSDVAAAIRELKAKRGRELQLHGSGVLFRWLLNNELVDEINLFTFPVVVGQGTRLFPNTGPDIALELVRSQSTPKGITIQVYRPTRK